MSVCPHCGGALTAPAPTAHRGELERQLGDVVLAARLRERAKSAHEGHGNAVRLAETQLVAWKGYVWARCRTRKTSTCAVTGVTISAGAWAWRQLSEVRDRDLRVSAYAWRDL